MIIKNYDNFLENIVNKRQSFIFKIEYPKMIGNIPPPPPKLKRTPRGVDTNNAIPNNNSIIYKFSKRGIDKNGREIFKFKGYDLINNNEIDIWWYISINGLHTVSTHFMYKDIWHLEKWNDFIFETVNDNYQ